MAKIKNMAISNADKDSEQIELSHVGNNVKRYRNFKKIVCQVL